MCDEVAPAFAAVPGLVSKVWLADRENGVYGGVYTFENGAAVDAYLASDLLAQVAANSGPGGHLGPPLRGAVGADGDHTRVWRPRPRSPRMAPMDCRSTGSTVVGRDFELSVLLRVLEEHGPRVCFVYGIAGIGKSSLLARFGEECDTARDRRCRGRLPVDRADRAGVPGRSGLGRRSDDDHHLDNRPQPRSRTRICTVVMIDTYEMFRIADPWLRHELLPALGPGVRVVVAGREPPMLEWSVERGQLGGLEVLPLGRLDEDSVQTIVRTAGFEAGPAATEIARVSRGHPLALRLALEARLAGGEMPEADAMSQVVDALAGAFRAGLDEDARRVLDAAAVPRRITRGVLAAMLGDNADDALETLSRLAFVEATSEGLRLHDAVQSAIVERLRAVDPERFRRYRAAAWHHLQTETRGVSRHELARSTADLLFLIDNPFVREAMFPTTAHAYSVEPARIEDAHELRSLWHRYDPPEAAHALDLWLERAPGAVKAIRDRSGALVGCSIVAEWCDIPPSLERDDPITGAWARHAARRSAAQRADNARAPARPRPRHW